jgi:GAF domain-containing protein
MSDELRAPPQVPPALAALAGVLLNEQAMDAILDLVTTLAHEALPHTAGVSVSLVRDGRVITAAYSSKLVKDLDHAQYGADEGPCIQAVRDGQRKHIRSLASEQRWPRFTAAAMEEGITSMLSMPLTVHDDSIGALNFYSRRPGNFTAADGVAGHFAAQAAIILANAQAYAGAEQLNKQLTEALATRDVIGEAKGILIEREKVTEDEAFEMLRQVSQHTNTKLRDVARQLVDSAQQDPGIRIAGDGAS